MIEISWKCSICNWSEWAIISKDKVSEIKLNNRYQWENYFKWILLQTFIYVELLCGKHWHCKWIYEHLITTLMHRVKYCSHEITRLYIMSELPTGYTYLDHHEYCSHTNVMLTITIMNDLSLFTCNVTAELISPLLSKCRYMQIHTVQTCWIQLEEWTEVLHHLYKNGLHQYIILYMQQLYHEQIIVNALWCLRLCPYSDINC